MVPSVLREERFHEQDSPCPLPPRGVEGGWNPWPGAPRYGGYPPLAWGGRVEAVEERLPVGGSRSTGRADGGVPRAGGSEAAGTLRAGGQEAG